MKIKNVRIYDLEESVIASGFPMLAEYDENEFAWQTENLKYWLDRDMLQIKAVLDRKDNSPENWVGENGKACVVCGKSPARKIKKFNGKYFCHQHATQIDRFGHVKSLTNLSPNRIVLDESGEFAWIILRNRKEEDIAKAKISCEDILKVCNIKFSIGHRRYVYSSRGSLHKIICPANIVDHINRDKLDCRRENLRSATSNQNSWNAIQRPRGSSKVLGVSWSKGRKKWLACITVYYKYKNLGYYENEDDAIIARLKAEVEYYKEFAPQNEMAKKYGIVNPYIVDDNKRKYNLGQALRHFDRMCKLASAPSASGHCNALTGILVSFNVTATNAWMLQAERYHFLQIVSSMSKMHRLKQIISNGDIPNVSKETSEWMRKLLNLRESGMISEEQLIYECPVGLELSLRITTNYLQLRTAYSQRKNHKLKEWRDFCEWIASLPYAREFITLEPENTNKGA